jgi:hypothetical protein
MQKMLPGKISMSLRRPTHTLWARCSKNGRGNVTRVVKS